MKFKSDLFRSDVITKRLIECKLSLRDAAEQIGTSSATLCRIEQEKPVDMQTFVLVCEWLKTEPGKYFEIIRPRQEGFKPNH